MEWAPRLLLLLAVLGRARTSSLDDCLLGMYGNATHCECYKCPAGRISAVVATNLSDCISCRAGRYQPLAGQQSCTPCAAGLAGTANGSTSQEAACTQLCAAGTYSEVEGLNTSMFCIGCAPGRYGKGTGQSRCDDCSAGSTSSPNASAIGAAIDLPGANLTFDGLDDGSGQLCAACGAGRFSNESGHAGPCHACQLGRYQDGSDGHAAVRGYARECTWCPVGKENGISGGTALGQ